MPWLSDPALRRLATALALGSLILVVIDTMVVAASMPLFSTRAVGIHGWPLVDIASAGSAILGAVIVAAKPRHPVGWLLVGIGACASFSLPAESYAVWVLDFDGPGPDRAADLAGLLAAFTGGALALPALSVTFLLVPTGRLLSRGWRWVAASAAAGYLSFCTAILVIGPHNAASQDEDNAAGSTLALVLFSAAILLILVAVLGSIVGMLVRLRRSDGQERQQVRLVAMGAAAIGGSLALLVVGETSTGGEQTWWSSLPLYCAYVFMIGCITVAVLRYRLSEVEVIVSRALVLAMAAGFAALGYVGLVVTFGQTVTHQADAGFWLSLLATVGVALAFQPLRRWVVRFADRLAYGTRAAPYDALADFSRRIGQSPAPGTVLPTIAAAAAEAVQADQAVVRLAVTTGPDLTAVWPPSPNDSDPLRSSRAEQASETDVVVPIVDHAGSVGSISLRLPPGSDIRPAERRLIDNIAEQAAVAFRNVELQAELAVKVKQLDRRNRELAASRSRIIGTADSARRRLESAIARRVLPSMSRLRTKLERSVDEAPDAATVEGFVAEATAALESLRELTRGIYPTMLTRSGLATTLTSYASRQQRGDVLTIDTMVAASRYAERVEAAAYFCCVEALTHGADDLAIDVSQDGAVLLLSVLGVDLDRIDKLAVVDRVEACGGSLEAVSLHGHSAIQVRLPVTAGQDSKASEPSTPGPTDGVNSSTQPPAMPAPVGRG